MNSCPNNFFSAVGTCLRKYANFSGRANRPEYWWFMVFSWLGNILLLMLDTHGSASAIFSLAMVLPSLAVHARRLHDIDKSGWWQLIALIPLIGWLILLYWVVQPSDFHRNRFG
jgi:uncharacterized membrane protein YhaH (DUF805 family)